MNARIKELIEEATIKERTNGAYGEHEWRGKLDPEKFARLIVRECADLFDPDLTVEHEEWIVRKSILQHFGIEE